MQVAQTTYIPSGAVGYPGASPVRRRADGIYEVIAGGRQYAISGLGAADETAANEAAKTDSGFIAWIKDNPWASALMAIGLVVLAWGVYSYLTKKKPKRRAVSGLGRAPKRKPSAGRALGATSAAKRSAAAKKAARTRKKNAAARSAAAKKAAAARKRKRR